MNLTKIKMGEAEFNRIYLIEFNGDHIDVTLLSQTDDEVSKLLKNCEEVINLQDGNFIALDCIGTSYSSVLNKEIIEVARKNAIKWFTKQVEYAKKTLEACELRLEQATTVKYNLD